MFACPYSHTRSQDVAIINLNCAQGASLVRVAFSGYCPRPYVGPCPAFSGMPRLYVGYAPTIPPRRNVGGIPLSTPIFDGRVATQPYTQLNHSILWAGANHSVQPLFERLAGPKLSLLHAGQHYFYHPSGGTGAEYSTKLLVFR